MSEIQAKVAEIVFGRWRSQTLHAGVKLGMFDELSDAPAAADDVARQLGLDPAMSYRLLRALGALGLAKEHAGRRFSITESGRFLRKDHPQSLRGITLLEEGPEHYALWKHLPAMVRDGKQNAFMREFGRMAFDHAAADPGYGAVFDAAMSSFSGVQTEWALDALRDVDFGAIRHLCDVGGGQGHMLCSFLAKYPHLSGTVLERAEVIGNAAALWAGKLGVADRCRYVAGDMFTDVPAADAYTMKMILHDWNDDECVHVLKLLHRRATAGGRMFIVEHVIPDADTPHFAKFFDIHMMCWGTGRERTGDEYQALLSEAGWRPVAVRHPRAGAMAVVEGAKAA
jgi:hypothetical protein